MSLKYGKAEVKAMIDVLDQDHETVEDAAKAALVAAETIFEKRANFVVCGQLAGTRERLSVPPGDPESISLALGWYSTEGDARKAAESLWHSTASGDTFRTVYFPVFHGTPADFHAKRKAELVAKAEKRADAARDRIRTSIKKREQEMADRITEIRKMEANAGGQQWPCPQVRVQSGQCAHDPACK